MDTLQSAVNHTVLRTFLQWRTKYISSLQLIDYQALQLYCRWDASRKRPRLRNQKHLFTSLGHCPCISIRKALRRSIGLIVRMVSKRG